MPARIAITGVGLVTPVGNQVDAFFDALLAGTSGVRFIDRFPTEKLRSDIAAMVPSFDASRALDDKERSMHGRVTQMLCASAEDAIEQAGLVGADGANVGVILATGQGPVEILEENVEKVRERGVRAVSPFFIPTVMPNAATALCSIKHGFQGPTFTMASACATGTQAMIVGAMLIAAGDADAMIVGGGEAAIFPNCVGGFGNARALARAYEGDPARASRPFDKHRTGFVMGEGAGAMVLERESHARARGATILGYLDGWGMASDAENIVRPHPEYRGVARSAQTALRRAELQPRDVSYVNPHATSTQQGDVAEHVALRAALGDALSSVPISATKSLIGHLLGGAGVVESIAALWTLRRGEIHPSINVDELDPQFADLDVVRARRKVDAKHVLKTSAGFGGHAAALVIGRA